VVSFIECIEQGLPPPFYKEQVVRKEGSRAKLKIAEEEISRLLEACTLNTLQHMQVSRPYTGWHRRGFEVLKHIGNSPDMNAIESAWMPIRIAITKDWIAPHTLEWTDRAWKGEWAKIP
jgi:hypothetical protein